MKHLPTTGEMVFFDRSWYNRALVEPVRDHVTVALIGGGFAGLIAGARLAEAGIDDVRTRRELLERFGIEIGGGLMHFDPVSDQRANQLLNRSGIVLIRADQERPWRVIPGSLDGPPGLERHVAK